MPKIGIFTLKKKRKRSRKLVGRRINSWRSRWTMRRKRRRRKNKQKQSKFQRIYLEYTILI